MKKSKQKKDKVWLVGCTCCDGPLVQSDNKQLTVFKTRDSARSDHKLRGGTTKVIKADLTYTKNVNKENKKGNK